MKLHLSRATMKVAASVLVGSVVASQSSAIVYQDDFNDGILNYPALWNLSQAGGPTITETGGAMLVSVPANSSGATFYAACDGLPNLVGDYDARVDFSLDLWPALSGIRVGLTIGGNSTERLNFDAGHPEWYLFEYNVNQWFTFETSDRTGSLRLQRTGNTITSSVFTENAWRVGGSWNQGSTADAPFRFWVWSHDPYFGDNEATIRFDNFYATDSAVPEPAGIAAIGFGLAVLRRLSARKVKES